MKKKDRDAWYNFIYLLQFNILCEQFLLLHIQLFIGNALFCHIRTTFYIININVFLTFVL